MRFQLSIPTITLIVFTLPLDQVIILRALIIFRFDKTRILSVILIAQFFGTMPVCGILSKDTRNVRFNWISVRFIVSLIFTLFATIEVATVMLMAMEDDITLGTAGQF